MRLFLILLVVFFMFSITVSAEQMILNVAGVVKNADGTQITADKTLGFWITNLGTSAKWLSSSTAYEITASQSSGGLFNAYLGASSALDLDCGSTYILHMAVAGAEVGNGYSFTACSSDVSWPEGSYCILRYEQSTECPIGLSPRSVWVGVEIVEGRSDHEDNGSFSAYDYPSKFASAGRRTKGPFFGCSADYNDCHDNDDGSVMFGLHMCCKG